MKINPAEAADHREETMIFLLYDLLLQPDWMKIIASTKFYEMFQKLPCTHCIKTKVVYQHQIHMVCIAIEMTKLQIRGLERCEIMQNSRCVLLCRGMRYIMAETGVD